MISEWMKVMLEEISRKKAEKEQARLDEQAAAEPVVLKSDTSGRENKIGYAEQPRDRGRGRTRP